MFWYLKMYFKYQKSKFLLGRIAPYYYWVIIIELCLHVNSILML